MKFQPSLSFFHVDMACFLMHYQAAFVTNKIEAVTPRCTRVRNHSFYCVLVQRRDVVDGLPGVGAPRNAKAKAEAETLDKLVLEVMALNHPKVIDRLLANLQHEAC